MTTKILLDVHAHLVPAIEGELSRFDGVTWDPSVSRFSVDGHVVGLKSIFAAKNLLDWMDQNDVEHAWISAPPPVYRPQLNEEQTALWCSALNRGLSAIASDHASRLTPLHHLPAHHPLLAARIATEKLMEGSRRFSMAAGTAGHALSSPLFDALWTSLNKESAFLFLHPGEGCDPRLDPFYLQNLLGNPSETAIAASHLVFAGILQRYADMKICLAHAGGTTAAVAGRWQRGHETNRPGLDVSREAPRSALRRLCVDCIAHDDDALALASAVFGESNILFGSDWPFPMGILKPLEQLAGLSDNVKKAMFCDNPKDLMRRN